MLRLTREIFDAMIVHARAQLPLEACGYLAANQGGVIERLYPLKNADASEEHYSLSPEEQFNAVRDMRTRGLRLAAAFHSHPRSQARPSAEDIRLAFDPEISYAILSLAGRVPVLKAFRIRDGLVEEDPVEIATPTQDKKGNSP